MAADAARAFALMRQHRYAVVLVDPYLTGGLSIDLPQIRHLQPETTILVATAYATPALRAASDSGEIGLVEKPQPVPFLAALVAGAVRKPKNKLWDPPHGRAGLDNQIRHKEKGENR